MFHANDPRAGLARATEHALPDAFFGASFGRFYADSPQEADQLSRSWYVRGQNFVVAYTKAESGAVLARQGQADEYVVLLPDEKTAVEITAREGDRPNAVTRVEGPSIVMVPPGPSTIRVVVGGQIIRLLTHQAHDLVERCSNASSYSVPHGNVAPLVPWPDPKGGWRVRAYRLDVPNVAGRFGRIWRCTTFMVNWFYPQPGPRDVTKMSPHHHDDFEQCSLALEGDFVHHLRWPWTVNMNAWREDQHASCASPSVVIIPPPSIHTTQATGKQSNILVDIFSPPRIDFSLKPGWVLNADDYEMPHV
ncbi:hypothetical protein ACVWYH_005667 [Bradyrhizobium sp. GM24.11]